MPKEIDKNPMGTVEFIERKNAILETITGLQLVPTPQISECLDEIKEPLDVKNDADACPYCRVYYDDDCEGCPMANADNECDTVEGSTYRQMVSALRREYKKKFPNSTNRGSVQIVDYMLYSNGEDNELALLVKEFNERNKNLLKG